jgi:hypothetical protein
MNAHPIDPVRSEKGVALIVVLLLLAVMAALTTGLTLNGQTEIAMATNEKYHAGARAAAEAGMNRAVEQIMNPAAAALDLLETGDVPVIGNGPFNLTAEYSYRFELVDDDDSSLYGGAALEPEQLLQMNENNLPDVDQNSRMILRSIGMGPKGTTVILGRVLHSIEIPDLPETDTIISDPAVLVNGNLSIAGNTKVLGEEGNVHANGNITGGGSEEISGDLTATGTIDADLEAGGLKSGGMPSIAIPEIKASDFLNLADWILTSTGKITNTAGVECVSTKANPCPAWSWKGGTWSISGAMPSEGTYYVQGDAEMHGTGNSGLTKVSVITEGSLKITGNGKFKPENGAGIQFVTNGDFEFGGTAEADDPEFETNGQIMVREQFKIQGNTKFQGRVMVENRDSTANAFDATTNPNGRKGVSSLTANSLSGNMRITYNGGLDEIETEFEIPGGASTYNHNISGWLEQ